MKTEYHKFDGFDLTLNEMRIIAHLCMGKDRHNICIDMEKAESTLNTQITAIFKETGTTKATELVTLMCELGFDRKGNFKGQSFL